MALSLAVEREVGIVDGFGLLQRLVSLVVFPRQRWSSAASRLRTHWMWALDEMRVDGVANDQGGSPVGGAFERTLDTPNRLMMLCTEMVLFRRSS